MCERVSSSSICSHMVTTSRGMHFEREREAATVVLGVVKTEPSNGWIMSYHYARRQLGGPATVVRQARTRPD